MDTQISRDIVAHTTREDDTYLLNYRIPIRPRLLSEIAPALAAIGEEVPA